MRLLHLLPIALFLVACGGHYSFDDIDVSGTVEHKVTVDTAVQEALGGTFADMCEGHSECVQAAMSNFYARLAGGSR